MSRNLGVPGGQVPPAARATAPGWRDPRLWVGIAIVAASVLVGARVLGAADDTVQVWAAGADVVAGEQLSEDDLVVQRVRFADGDDLERYFTVDDDLPDVLTLARPLGAGELLPRSALGDDDVDAVTISLAVPPQYVPSSVGPGAVVDVRVLGDPAEPGRATEVRSPGDAALSGVTVVAAPANGDALAGGGDRQVELAVPDDAVADFYALLASVTNPVITLAQVG